MGLDMYFKARKYMSKFDEYEIAKKLRKQFNVKDSGNLETTEICFEIGYLRKADAIHKWLVENIQDGKDECQDSYFSKEKIEELRYLIEEVLEDKSLEPSMLETKGGFFFGSQDYDEYYFSDLEEMKKICDYALELIERNFDIFYHSSW